MPVATSINNPHPYKIIFILIFFYFNPQKIQNPRRNKEHYTYYIWYSCLHPLWKWNYLQVYFLSESETNSVNELGHYPHLVKPNLHDPVPVNPYSLPV